MERLAMERLAMPDREYFWCTHPDCTEDCEAFDSEGDLAEHYAAHHGWEDEEGGWPAVARVLGGDYAYLDNEGRGQCMYAAVRDALVIGAPDAHPFLAARTRGGARTLHTTVQALRAAVADKATVVDMQTAVELYASCTAQRDLALDALEQRKRADPGQLAAAQDEYAEAVSLCANFEHARRAHALGLRSAGTAAQLKAYRGSLRARTQGDAASVPRLESTVGIRLVVARSDDGGGSAYAVVHEHGVPRDTERNILLEHVEHGPDSGHYVLIVRALTAEGDDALEEAEESLASAGGHRLDLLEAAGRAGHLQAVFTNDELPRL